MGNEIVEQQLKFFRRQPAVLLPPYGLLGLCVGDDEFVLGAAAGMDAGLGAERSALDEKAFAGWRSRARPKPRRANSSALPRGFSGRIFRRHGRHSADQFPSLSPPQLGRPQPAHERHRIGRQWTRDPISSIIAPAKTDFHLKPNRWNTRAFPRCSATSASACRRLAPNLSGCLSKARYLAMRFGGQIHQHLAQSIRSGDPLRKRQAQRRVAEREVETLRIKSR